MKHIFFIVLTICFASCNNSNSPAKLPSTDTTSLIPKKDTTLTYIHQFADTSLQNKITAALLKLPFVIKSNHYIDSLSNHTKSIAFMLDEPQGNEIDIPVQAGYNGDQRFETYFHFLVNPKTMEIKVYDPVEDKTLSIKEYLKTQQ